MAVVTPQTYHEDETLHGNYQYTSLEDLLKPLELETIDNGSYLEGVKRSTLIRHSKQAIREINKRAANDPLATSFTVPNDLVFALPQNYVNYIRVSVVTQDESTGSKRLQPLNINYNINIATGYLQDNDAKILFDENGQILTSDGDNAYGQPYSKYAFVNAGGQFKLDTSKLSQYGEFTIDERRGKILFSSELMDKEIVLEYISDGLHANLSESEIMVHKDIIMPIQDFIYHACIQYKRLVPANEKERALRRYKTTLHQAKLDRSDINFIQISRVMRTKSMN